MKDIVAEENNQLHSQPIKKVVQKSTNTVVNEYIAFLEKTALEAINKGDIELAEKVYGKLTHAAAPILGVPELDAPLEKSLEFLAKADPQDVQAIAVSQISLLHSYYKTVLGQAQNSFIFATVAATVGILIFVYSFAGQSKDNASLKGVISGAIVEVISGIGFYLYSKSSDQMAKFHEQLTITQRFLLANSVCESLESESKQKTRSDLVKAIANIKSIESSNELKS